MRSDPKTSMAETESPNRPHTATEPLEASRWPEPENGREEVGATAPRLGRYVLLERLGAGSMGVVHSAYDPELDRRVAIKVLHPGVADSDSRQRLLREAQAMARLSHPHVVAVYDVGTVGDDLFIAMELISGGDLGSWLESEPREWREALRVLLQAGRGLEAAHQAGLVHRDFKPENVLVGPEGRARVTDFGLARSDSELMGRMHAGLLEAELDAVSEGSGTAPLEAGLTETGALLGTPAYMAPELFAGQVADSKTDQFSFCVALWQALYGARPFQGKNLPLLMKAIVRGRITAPPKNNVPPWIHQVLVRGLAPDPEDRWPSMSSLLDALRSESRRRRQQLVATAAAGLILLLGVAWWRGGAVEEDPCRWTEDRLVGVWDGPKRTEVGQALTADGSAFGAATWGRVGPALDAYARRWSELSGQFCQAHQRGEGTAALYDRRVACLDGRRVSLAALADLLSQGETTITRGAARAVVQLPSLDRCTDSAALLSGLPPPADETTAQRVEHLREDLAEVSVLLSAGMLQMAQDKMTALLPAARAADYSPLLAEVLERSGALASQAFDLPRAEADLLEAWEVALSVDHPEVEFAIAFELSRLLGIRQSRFEEADFWVRNLRALTNRVPDPPTAQDAYLRTLGLISSRRGETVKALEIFEEALEHGIEHSEEGSLTVARTLNLLGSTHARLGQFDEALVEFQKAHRILADLLGERHPDVAGILLNLGNAYGALGRYEEEREAMFEGLAMLRETYGENHVLVGRTLVNLGASALSGPEPRPGEALEHLEVSLGILRSSLGDDHADVARTLTYQGRAQLALEQRDAARRSFVEAIETFERIGMSEHPLLASTLSYLGELQLDEQRPHEALAPLERALVLRQREAADPHLEAETQFLLARALWQVGAQDRAVRLAEGARDLFLGSATPPEEIDVVERWLDSRGRP